MKEGRARLGAKGRSAKAGKPKATRVPSPEIIKAKADKAAATSAGEDPDAIEIPGDVPDPTAEPGVSFTPFPLKPPHPGGRPSAYNKAFCARVIKLGAEGMGKAEIAYELGVVRQTLENWMEKHPEFLDAMGAALDASRAWWEKQGRAGTWGGKAFNANAYGFQVRNRFPDDWRQDTSIDLEGGNVTIQIVKYAGTPKGGK